MTPPLIAHVLGAESLENAPYIGALVVEVTKDGAEEVVTGPPEANERYGFTTDPRVRFVALELPRPDLVDPGRFPTAVRDVRLATTAATIVHAHGHMASLLAVAAVGRQVPLIATWDDDVPHRGTKGAIWGAVQRVLAHRAAVICGGSSAVLDRMRGLGARDVRLVPPSAPPARPPGRSRAEVRTEVGEEDGPLIVSVGERQANIVMDAMEALSERAPEPVLVEGGSAPAVELLAAADVVVQSDVPGAPGTIATVQEILRAGVPLVLVRPRTPVTGPAMGSAERPAELTDVVGDAALIVESEPSTVAESIGRILDDTMLSRRLSAAGRRQATTWPDESDTVTQLITIYRELMGS